MQELIHAAIQAATIPYTILFLVVLMYWLAVLIGIFDLGSADFDINTDIDVDVEVDIDADVEVDADAEADGGTGGGWLAGTLTFFNFGRVPFMIIMTFLVLAMWTISILAHYFTGNGTLIFAAALFIPNLFVSLIFAKIITSPLIRVFRHFDGNVEAIDYIKWKR